MKRCVAVVSLMLSTLMNGHLAAQTYPSKPIRFIVPYPAGGGGDTVARLMAQGLSTYAGARVIVDNRDGASTMLGTEIAARSLPDGYTIYMGNNTSLGINPALAFAINPGVFKNLPYDPVRDFAPIILLAKAPLVLVINPAVPANNLKELIALARAKPGRLNYAAAGVGVTPHLAGEFLKSMAKIDIVLVTYRGSAQMMSAVIAGEVEMTFTNVVSSLPLVRAGKLKAIAVTDTKRSSALPDVPTVEETAGLKGYEAGAWYGVLAPAKTPREIVTRLNNEMARVLSDGKVRERLVADGAEPVGGTPEEFGRFIRAGIEKWTRVIKQSGIRLE